MNERGMNGQLNPARPVAISAMIVLCLSLMVFFVQFANVFIKQGNWSRMVKIGGVLSMISAILMFTKYHDLMTMISSFFGLFVVVGIIRVIYRSELTIYKITGIVCVLLLGLNNYIYYSTHFLEWLPLIQKITLLLVLIWIIGLNYELGRKIAAKIRSVAP